MSGALNMLAVTLLAAGVNSQVPRSGIETVPQSDQAITSRIEQELRTNVQLHDAGISVSTSDGVVTLKGSVAARVEKARAEQLGRQVTGVREIRNELTVGTSASNHWNVAALVEQEFAEDPLLREHELSVESCQGIVILGGAVQTPYQKSHAERIARQAPGVLFVRNEIRVQAQTDESLRTVVQEELESDERFDSLLVDVRVEEQVVILLGYVESPLQRDLAESRAESVPGVAGVENRLVVAYSPRDTSLR